VSLTCLVAILVLCDDGYRSHKLTIESIGTDLGNSKVLSDVCNFCQMASSRISRLGHCYIPSLLGSFPVKVLYVSAGTSVDI
jgi:hypothetical protein